MNGFVVKCLRDPVFEFIEKPDTVSRMEVEENVGGNGRRAMMNLLFFINGIMRSKGFSEKDLIFEERNGCVTIFI